MRLGSVAWMVGMAGAKLLAGPPALLPGEGMALSTLEGPTMAFGEARRIAPMGSLAKLVWMRMEGQAWRNRGVTFTCTGTWKGHTCWNREGHGTVDLREGLAHSCNLAFLAWIEASLSQQGPDRVRARMVTAFAPFWGLQVHPEGELLLLGPPWIGDGDLLRTSPEAFLAWLRAPEQGALRALLTSLLGPNWVKTGTAPIPGRTGLTSAWVAGWDGRRLAVLHLPQGRGKVEGLARWRALMDPRP